MIVFKITLNLYRDERKKFLKKVGSEEAASGLPTYREIQSSLYDRKHRKFPPLPKDLGDFTIMNEYSETLVGKQRFLLHDSSPNKNERITIFSSDEQIKFLATCKRWGADVHRSSTSNYTSFLAWMTTHVCRFVTRFSPPRTP